MEKPSHGDLLRAIARGEVDLDRIAEAIRSADLVIRSYQRDLETLRGDVAALQSSYQKEKSAADELAQRLAALHAENRLARSVFLTEIEGKRSFLGTPSSLDLEALDMAGLIAEREKMQKRIHQAAVQ
jgi:hypothetical protein